MSHYRRKSKFTFGNILIGLLLLGTLTVITLIILVYFELTRTPKHTPSLPMETSAPALPVEAMSPDGRPVAPAVQHNNLNNPQQKAASETAIQKEADEAVAALKTDDNPINTRALTAGTPPPRKPRPRRPKEPTGENAQNNRHNNANRGEVALEPTNTPPRGERPLTPRNSRNSESSGSTQRARNNNDSGERALSPVKPPQRNNHDKPSEAIDALF